MTIEAAPIQQVPLANVENTETTNKPVVEPVANTEPNPGTESVEKPKEEAKPRNALKERFRELTTNLKFAKADTEILSEIISEFTNTKAPTRSDYSSEEEYQESVANFRETLRAHKANLAVAESKVQKIESKIQSEEEASWTNHVDEANIPDYDEKVSQAKIPISTEMYNAIIGMKKDGPKLVYHLATNPDEAYAISQLTPHQQLIALGELRASIKNPVAPNIPAPVINPNNPPSHKASATSAVTTSIKDSTPEERATWSHEQWLKWRKSQKE